ncbi:MAG: restriction endonuclease subunit S [Gammaproteobacteria bacterium]|nr:restriction endonuclease subunit S [Gammaproteobacteria bacterium]
MAPLESLCRGKGKYGANVPKRAFDPHLPRYVRITDIDDSGRLRKDSAVSISEDDAAPYVLSEGDILLARSGATVGKSYVYTTRDGLCAHAGYLIRFTPDASQLRAAFLKQVLQSSRYWDWVNTSRRAQAQPNINAAEYGQFPVLLPPLPEQRKIAAILSSVDAVIEQTEAVIAQLQVVKKAMMQALLTRGMPGRHTRFKQTEIGEVPEAWEVVALDQLIEPGRPICYGILKPGRGYPGGVPVVKVKNIVDGRIEEDGLLLTSPEIDHQYRRSRLQEGDILLSIRGTTGRLAIVPHKLDGANITQDSARIAPKKAVSRDYLYCCLQSPQLQLQIKDHTKGQAVQGINIRDVRDLKIPLPVRAEQEAIASVLFGQADYQANLSRTLVELRYTKAALMSVLLTGELRVNVDEDAAA